MVEPVDFLPGELGFGGHQVLVLRLHSQLIAELQGVNRGFEKGMSGYVADLFIRDIHVGF